MEEQGKWEEQIRSKIYDFEADTIPEDWDVIAAGLEGGKIVRLHFYRRLAYIASAAAVIALLIVGGFFLFSDEKSSVQLAVVENTTPITASVVDNSLPSTSANDLEDVEVVTIPDDSPVDKTVNKPVDNLLASTVVAVRETLSDTQEEAPATVKPLPVDKILTPQNPPVTVKPLPVDETDRAQKTETDAVMPPTTEIESPDKYLAQAPTVKPRRWSFGMGGGGFAIGSTTGGAPVTTTSRPLSDDEYMRNGDEITLRNGNGIQNSTLFDPIEGLDYINQLGKVKHQLPISAGLGISYRLTDRWALQSGVVYTLRRSKGKYMDEANNIGEWKRNLHFIGIPLSASYRIVEWNRLQIYATAGGMGEWNFAGKRKEIITVGNLETIDSEKVRMKESLWSVYARAGATYPLWKFVYVYAETGVSYYFDNKSPIELFSLDKPFYNVSLQAGIRLGF